MCHHQELTTRVVYLFIFPNYTRMGLIFAAAQIMIAAKTCVARAEVCAHFRKFIHEFEEARQAGKYRNRNPYEGISGIPNDEMELFVF
ncbi:hypothetical protein CDAR_384411 [Caerostris darwini]|uniref:Uncharacterized protein n=1 Tax=Caerostris darwini TaxID=1538125 RepID=A0AAV4M5Z5_9ARAC|nr:hypothetical protein CDAR_384411 [Caerostris darwini]